MNLREFSETAVPALDDYLRAVQLVAKVIISDRVESLAPPKSPVGSGRDPHPGLLRDSWQAVPGAEGTPTIVGNTAPHAVIINRGRIHGPSGRLLGSSQQPQGIMRPTGAAIRNNHDSLVDEIVARVESDAGGEIS